MSNDPRGTKLFLCVLLGDENPASYGCLSFPCFLLFTCSERNFRIWPNDQIIFAKRIESFFRDHQTAHRPDHWTDSALIPWLFDNHALEYHFRDQAPYRDQKIVAGVEECVACRAMVVIVVDFFEKWQKYLAEVIFQEQLWFPQIAPSCLLRFVFAPEGGILFDLIDNHIQLITFRKMTGSFFNVRPVYEKFLRVTVEDFPISNLLSNYYLRIKYEQLFWNKFDVKTSSYPKRRCDGPKWTAFQVNDTAKSWRSFEQKSVKLGGQEVY